jgi:2'-5' RNA ligase
MTGLYYIGILPSQEVQETVLAIKQDLQRQFGLKHALKSPAHLTLQMPFRMNQKREKEIKYVLESSINNRSTFEVNINGWDHFDNRVIFLAVNQQKRLKKEFDHLQEILRSEFKLPEEKLTRKFHPHITIAHRDLIPVLYAQVWKYVQNIEFLSSFTVNNYSLLKHNGASWEVLCSICFPNN